MEEAAKSFNSRFSTNLESSYRIPLKSPEIAGQKYQHLAKLKQEIRDATIEK